MNTSFNDVSNAVLAMNMDQINELSSLIRFRHDQLQKQTAYEFSIGDRASFKDHHGQTVYGTVEKINRKTVRLRADSGTPWKVSSTLLTKV